MHNIWIRMWQSETLNWCKWISQEEEGSLEEQSFITRQLTNGELFVMINGLNAQRIQKYFAVLWTFQKIMHHSHPFYLQATLDISKNGRYQAEKSTWTMWAVLDTKDLLNSAHIPLSTIASMEKMSLLPVFEIRNYYW